MSDRDGSAGPSASVELHWIPLGAGANVVRVSGRLYESLSAWIGRRRPQNLFHSALTLSLPEGRYTIEQTPVPDLRGELRGVVAEGPVAIRCAGRLRHFRYEVRCWRDGTIPDLQCPGSHSQLVTSDAPTARLILDTLATVPTPTWGRDELRAGEMWNSNSVIAWVLTRSGIEARLIAPPAGGRAPGWAAGCVVARRDPRPSPREPTSRTHPRSPRPAEDTTEPARRPTTRGGTVR